ncbi:MAG TPA: tetratricopeptide repeat protein, partial [Gemmatimonadales bacterium]|nr:tetratricopeptide repeat protein [Gemmatimonadales bacterium]
GDVNAMYEWDWPSADRNFKKSLALDPNNANTYHWYNGDFLLTVGRTDEALALARRAKDLDPLSFTINGGVGRALHTAGRQEESAAHLRGLLALDSTFPLVNEWLGTTYLAQGKFADAVPLLQRAADPRYSIAAALLGYALAKSGRRQQAEALRRELMDRQSREYVVPTSLALINLGLGDTAATFVWLDRAVKVHDPFIIYNFVNEPMFEPLKREPRGAAILREMGLRQTR